jgi:hypothetical protein
MSGEDSLPDTVVPRLLAGGADLRRVASYAAGGPGDGPAAPVFPGCVPELERLITERSARLLVVDPLPAFLPPGYGSLCDQSVRVALRPVAALAARTGCAVLLVRHLTKSRPGRAVYRGSGSVGLIGVTRTALLLARSPQEPDVRVLAVSKTNLGPAPPALAFRLGEGPGGAGPEWLGPVGDTADDLTAARPAGRRLTAAAGWLRDLLAGGPVPQTEVAELARAAGFSERTLDRAKAELPALSRQTRPNGRSVWVWYLPTLPPSPFYDSPLPPLDY